MLVWPIEKFLFRRADRVVATEADEAEWIERFVRNRAPGVPRPTVQLLDLGSTVGYAPRAGLGNCKFLFVGRMHPLKGVEFLERAVAELNQSSEQFELRIVSDHFGEELEKDWDWCDVLCLPTLSENFGRVVAEALERGKRVVTTDGAPAWATEERNKEEGIGNKCGRLIYLRGYRDGTDEERVKLLKVALEKISLV